MPLIRYGGPSLWRAVTAVVSCLAKVLFHVHKIKFFRVYGKKMMKNANSCDESFEPDHKFCT